VLLKGGHLEGDTVVDLLRTRAASSASPIPRIKSEAHPRHRLHTRLGDRAAWRRR